MANFCIPLRLWIINTSEPSDFFLTWRCGPRDPGVDELDVVQRLLLAQQVFVTAGVTHLQTWEILGRHAGQTADQALRITVLTSPLIKSYWWWLDSAMSLLLSVFRVSRVSGAEAGWTLTRDAAPGPARPASGAGAKPGHPPAPAAWPGRVCTNA